MSFDIVFCDHGAMTFADPHRTVPQAARVLRPGGLFAFNVGSILPFPRNGFEVEDLIELRPHARARTTYGDHVRRGWARRWPAENIWKLRKRG